MSFQPSFDIGSGPEMDEPEFSRAQSRRTTRTNRTSAQPSIQLKPPRPPSSVYSRSVTSPYLDDTGMPGSEEKDSRFVDGWMHPAMRRTTMSSIGSYSGLVRLPSEDESHPERRPSEPDSSINTDATSSDADKIISRAGIHRRQPSIGSAEHQGQVSTPTASRRKRRWILWKIAFSIMCAAIVAMIIVISLLATKKIGNNDESTGSESATAAAEQPSRATTSSQITTRNTGHRSIIDPTAGYNSITTLPRLSPAPIATTPAGEDGVEIYKIPTTITTAPSRETNIPFDQPLSGLYPPLSRTSVSMMTGTAKRSIEELVPGSILR